MNSPGASDTSNHGDVLRHDPQHNAASPSFFTADCARHPEAFDPEVTFGAVAPKAADKALSGRTITSSVALRVTPPSV